MHNVGLELCTLRSKSHAPPTEPARCPSFGSFRCRVDVAEITVSHTVLAPPPPKRTEATETTDTGCGLSVCGDPAVGVSSLKRLFS